MGHQELGPEGRQLLQRVLVDRAADRRLLRLLQGDLLQGGRQEPPGRRGQAEEEQYGEGGQDCDAGLLQPRGRQRQHHVHGLAGAGDDAGAREPAQRLGGRPFAGQLRRSVHDLWDVQTVGERR